VGALLVTLLRAIQSAFPSARARPLRRALAGLAALWVVHDLASAEVAPSHRAVPLLNAEQVAVALRRAQPEPRPLPSIYRCGEAPESSGIKFNGSGWATPGGCEVHAATMLFLERPQCVRVHLEPPAGVPPLSADGTTMVRAKLGLSEMRRVADEPSGDGRALTFCIPADHRPNPHGIELLYLGWTTPDALSPDVRPFRLLEVAPVPAP
jgi:hypothetical protein